MTGKGIITYNDHITTTKLPRPKIQRQILKRTEVDNITAKTVVLFPILPQKPLPLLDHGVSGSIQSARSCGCAVLGEDEAELSDRGESALRSGAEVEAGDLDEIMVRGWGRWSQFRCVFRMYNQGAVGRGTTGKVGRGGGLAYG